MYRIVKRTLLMMGMTWLTTSCALYHHYGPHYGKVVDASTKEPIEGAAVVAIYYTQLYTPAGGIGKYLDAQEAVTDKNGEFKIASLNSFAFRPFQSFESLPWFRIFRPNYGCYPSHKGIRQKPTSLPKGLLPSNEYVTIELPYIGKEPHNVQLESLFCVPSSEVPEKNYPKFLQLIQEERRTLGLNTPHSVATP